MKRRIILKPKYSYRNSGGENGCNKNGNIIVNKIIVGMKSKTEQNTCSNTENIVDRIKV